MDNTKVTTNVIADDAITLDKMAGLARGKIIYGDSSGNPAALAVGSNGQVLKSDGTDISWGTDSSNDRDGAAVFNESGAAVDFRIEGDTATNLFFVDGSADKIGINTSSPGAWLEVKDDGSLGHDMVLIQGGGASGDYNLLNLKANNGEELFKVNASSYHTYLPNASSKLGIGMASGAGHSLDVAGDAEITYAGDGNSPSLHVLDSADSEVAWFEGKRAGDTGAYISIYHNPSSIAESNRAGLRFQGGNDAGQKVNYGMFLQRITDYTDGTEDGEMQFHLMSGGSLEEKIAITPDQLRLKGDAGSSFIRVDNRADGHDTGFEIYQNASRKWELHSDDSNSDTLSFRNSSGTEKFSFAQDGTFTAGNKAGKVAFRAYLGSSTAVSSGTHNFYGSSALTQEFDVGSCFNPSTGKFTAPQAGTYHFSATITMGADTETIEYLSAEIVATPSGGSATRYVCGGWNSKPTGDNAYASSAGSVTIQLAASEEVTLGYETSDAITLQGGIGHCSFSGFLVA